MAVTFEALTRSFAELGMAGSSVEVHSSLSSFGNVAGGADTVVRALRHVFSTALVPSYCELGRTYPPADDHPEQNGTNYETYRPSPGDDLRPPFNAADFGVNSPISEDMGVLPRVLLGLEGAMRSKHPSVSWGAVGDDADNYVNDHPDDDPMRPLKRLAERNGNVLLLGVGFTRCTAIHLAEELAGRRPFIRWIRHSDGSVKRTYEYGCSEGFENLAPQVADIERSVKIGTCLARAYPLKPLLERAADAIEGNPSITACLRMCSRCRDAIKGGPAG